MLITPPTLPPSLHNVVVEKERSIYIQVTFLFYFFLFS